MKRFFRGLGFLVGIAVCSQTHAATTPIQLEHNAIHPGDVIILCNYGDTLCMVARAGHGERPEPGDSHNEVARMRIFSEPGQDDTFSLVPLRYGDAVSLRDGSEITFFGITNTDALIGHANSQDRVVVTFEDAGDNPPGGILYSGSHVRVARTVGNATSHLRRENGTTLCGGSGVNPNKYDPCFVFDSASAGDEFIIYATAR